MLYYIPMKVKFFQRLNTRLSLIPLLLIFVFLIAAGIGFYFSGYAYLIKDFYRLHLINLSAEKKLAVDSWGDYYKKDIEELLMSGLFRDNILILTGNHPFIRSKKKITEAEANISILLEEKAASGKYHAISVLSKEGNVLLSSKQDLIGEDLSKEALFKESVSSVKSTIGLNTKLGTMDFISVVSDANGNIAVLLLASVPLKELADSIRTKESLYKSEKVEIIDKEGNILTKDGISPQKYDIQEDNRFSYAVNLDNINMRLISSVYKSEALMPLNILLIAYFSLVGIVFLFIVKSSYLSKRLITKPVLKLTDIIKSLSAGEFNVDFGDSYKGEIRELKESLKNMVEELKKRESYLIENTKLIERVSLKSTLYSKIAHDLKRPLVSRNLLQFAEDLFILSRLENGKLSISVDEFNMCELLKDIEDFGKKLIGTKEIELIVDCQDVFMNKTVYIDRQHLKKIITNILINAIESTEIGTITILCSEILEHHKEHIEILIADTGKGIEVEMINDVFEEFTTIPFALIVSKKLTNALGGKIEVQSMPGRGSVFTITIPVKNRISLL